MLTIRWSDAVEVTMFIVVFAAIFPLDLRNDRTVRPIPAAQPKWGCKGPSARARSHFVRTVPRIFRRPRTQTASNFATSG